MWANGESSSSFTPEAYDGRAGERLNRSRTFFRVATSGRSPGKYVLAAAVAVWLAVTLGFVALLAVEYVSVRLGGCEYYDSTYGEKRWQWFPPGSYCYVSKAEAERMVP